MAETENKAASVVNVAFAVAGAVVAVYIVFRIAVAIYYLVSNVAFAVARAAIAIFGSTSTSTTTNKKTMKAPGKNVRIFRDDFAGDPKSYFRKLRNK